MATITHAATVLRIVAIVQAALFAALSLVAVGIFGLGLLFAVGDAPASQEGRDAVVGGLAVGLLVVLVPIVVTLMFTAAAVRSGRRPREAAITMLVGEVVGGAFLLWPQLRPWIFGLPTTTSLALVDLVATVPAVVLALAALASGDVRTGLPDRRRADPAPAARRRH